MNLFKNLRKLERLERLLVNTAAFLDVLSSKIKKLMPTDIPTAQGLLEQINFFKLHHENAEACFQEIEKIAALFYRSKIMYTMWKKIVRRDFVKASVRRARAALEDIRKLATRIEKSYSPYFERAIQLIADAKSHADNIPPLHVDNPCAICLEDCDGRDTWYGNPMHWNCRYCWIQALKYTGFLSRETCPIEMRN